MNIKKDGKNISLIGKKEVVTNFVKNYLIPDSVVSKAELDNGFVEYKVMDNEEKFGYIAESLMDFYDDILFDVMVNYNELFEKKADFRSIEHSGIVIDGRSELLKIINEYK